MNTKEKYDEIIDLIENRVAEGIGVKPGELADQVAREKGKGDTLRDLSTVIRFMTGDQLIPYIKKRQMMKAYEVIIDENNSGSIDTAIAYTGLGDHPAFARAFRRQFDMTPSEAKTSKDKTLITPPQTWSVISADYSYQKSYFEEEEEENMAEILKFGVDKEKFAKITEALDLQEVYSFSDAQSEAAFSLADMYNLGMRETFEFVDDYTMQFCTDDEGKPSESWSGLQKLMLAAHPLIYTYFTFHLSINESLNLIEDLAANGVHDITKESVDFLNVYLGSDFTEYSYKALKHCFNYYIKNTIGAYDYSDFESFMINVSLLNGDLEAALSIYDDYDGGDGVNDTGSHDYEAYRQFEKWAAEETDYASHERHDTEPDIDNLAYEDEDDDFLDF